MVQGQDWTNLDQERLQIPGPYTAWWTVGMKPKLKHYSDQSDLLGLLLQQIICPYTPFMIISSGYHGNQDFDGTCQTGSVYIQTSWPQLLLLFLDYLWIHGRTTSGTRLVPESDFGNEERNIQHLFLGSRWMDPIHVLCGTYRRERLFFKDQMTFLWLWFWASCSPAVVQLAAHVRPGFGSAAVLMLLLFICHSFCVVPAGFEDSCSLGIPCRGDRRNVQLIRILLCWSSIQWNSVWKLSSQDVNVVGVVHQWKCEVYSVVGIKSDSSAFKGAVWKI